MLKNPQKGDTIYSVETTSGFSTGPLTVVSYTVTSAQFVKWWGAPGAVPDYWKVFAVPAGSQRRQVRTEFGLATQREGVGASPREALETYIAARVAERDRAAAVVAKHEARIDEARELLAAAHGAALGMLSRR